MFLDIDVVEDDIVADVVDSVDEDGKLRSSAKKESKRTSSKPAEDIEQD